MYVLVLQGPGRRPISYRMHVRRLQAETSTAELGSRKSVYNKGCLGKAGKRGEALVSE